MENPDYQRMLEVKHWDWHYYKFNQDSWCYRNKLMQVVPYGINGVLWYQGESNRHPAEAVYYNALLQQMINNWRDLWGENLPFYIVQIAPFADSPENDWSHIRRCQDFVTHTVPHTYLCTLVHTGEADNIHPTKKHRLAEELTNAVLANAFGYDREYCGPIVEKAEKTAGGAVVTFSHADGLHFDGDPADITVYDGDGNTLPYTVAVEGNTLLFAADGIARVEMGWQNDCIHNLYNSAGYLASPFQIFL